MNKISNSSQQFVKYKDMKVKILSVLATAAGILLYFGDILSDLYISIKHYRNRHMTYFGLTLFLYLLSAIVSSLFSLYLYCIDDKIKELKVSRKTWKRRAVFLILGIAPVLRSYDALYFSWKSYLSTERTKKHIYARRMIFEINDGAFLRLFEAFLESGPQLVLQLYIFAQIQSLNENVFGETEIWMLFSMLLSSISLSHSVVSYLNSLRNSLDSKNELKIPILILLFFWRFFEVISRVIVMGFGISTSLYFLVLFVVHLISAYIWVYSLKTDFCDDRYAEKVYNVLLSVILVFVYFNPKDSPTKMRCIIFYIVICLENTMTTLCFYYYFPPLIFKLPATVIQVLSFIFSIMLMVIYYKFFHPTVEKLTKKKTQENSISGDVVGKEEVNGMVENTILNNYVSGATMEITET